MDRDCDLRAALDEGLGRALDFLLGQQREDGSWRGEYGGPMFLLPMYVIACAVAGRPVPPARRAGMVACLRHYTRPDGSIGLHEEDEGCMFTTALGYVSLRWLGEEPSDPLLRRMRAWMHSNGTALGAASWGKLLLALMNLYPYEGLNPILPELWLLPRATPFHPGRMWCHSRMVYLPMAWLYGRRAAAPVTALTEALRLELYGQPYATLPFARCRDRVCPADDRYPISGLLRIANRAMGAFERRAPAGLRRRALDEVLAQIRFEDRVTHFLDIGPVNSVLNTLVHHFREPGGVEERLSFEALERYLVDSPEGVKLNGYNNTAVWDTVFAVQALRASPHAERAAPALLRANGFLEANQILEDVPEPERHHRHRSAGGWPFSDREHGWPITDCTAEGLKVALDLAGRVPAPIPTARLEQAVRLILSFQNRDGGWASYERKRAGGWMEWLNPSHVFHGIMVDQSYVECTSSCVQALAAARRRIAADLSAELPRAIRRGAEFIRARQLPEGGWVGSWAVCFTYATWFAVTGLRAAGAPASDPALRRACGFLLERQNRDGGWGEHHRSCVERRWLRADSTAAQTAWALMSLLRSGLGHALAARRGAEFLLRTQGADGDWPEAPLVGVFNRTALIDYENYRRYFPIWALAEFARAQSRTGLSALS